MELYMKERRNKNNNLAAEFATQYVNHLLPALEKASQGVYGGDEETTESHKLMKIVRYEVDMAMVLSTQGFAWSRALKHKLSKQNVNVGKFNNSPTALPLVNSFNLLLTRSSEDLTTCIAKQKVNGSLAVVSSYIQSPLLFVTTSQLCPKNNIIISPCLEKPSLLTKSHQIKNVKLRRSRQLLHKKQAVIISRKKVAEENNEEENKEEEEEEVSKRIDGLRKVLPGGNAMGVEELLKEMGSYLVCLQQQVNILRCIVESESDL